MDLNKMTFAFFENLQANQRKIAESMACKKCKGGGWYFVQNGPDDYDKEVCDCQLN